MLLSIYFESISVDNISLIAFPQIFRASTGSVISLVNVLIHMSRMQAELLQAEHASQAIASW